MSYYDLTDTIVWNGKTCCIYLVNGALASIEHVFDAAVHFHDPIIRCSDCQRGFVCQFSVDQKGDLKLQELEVCMNGVTDTDEYPVYNGVQARPVDDGIRRSHAYHGLDVPVDFSGTLLVYDAHNDFFHQILYKNYVTSPDGCGPHRLIELYFDCGKLISSTDWSKLLLVTSHQSSVLQTVCAWLCRDSRRIIRFFSRYD